MICVNLFYTMLRMQLLRRNAPFAALAFAISLALLPLQYFPTGDGVLYAKVGRNIWSGLGICSFPGEPYINHPPFYPLLIGLFNFFLGRLELSAHLVSSLAFALTLFPLLSLARAVYGDTTARWTGLLYATNGFLLIYSNMMIADFVFLFLAVSQIFIVHRMLCDRASPFQALSLGLLGGLGFLTRPEGCLYFLAGIAALMALGSGSRGRRCGYSALAMLSFSAFAMPYLYFVHHVSGAAQASGLAGSHIVRRFLELAHPAHYRDVEKWYEGLAAGGKSFQHEHWTDGVPMLAYFIAAKGALLKSSVPSAFARLGGLSQYFYQGLGFLFVGMGWFARPWDAQRKKTELLLLLYLSLFLPYLFLQFVPRYFLTVFPVLLLWTGHGIEMLRVRCREDFALSVNLSSLIALGICVLFAGASGWYVQRCLHHNRSLQQHKDMGLWMNHHVPEIEKQTVAAQEPYTAFYSGAKDLRLPYVLRFEDFKEFMRHRRARYFVIGEDLAPPQSESYGFLWRTKDFPSGLALRHRTGGDKRLYLFEVQP